LINCSFCPSNYSVKDLVVMEWSRLKMSSVLRLFWAIRLLDLFILSLLTKEFKNETLFGTVKYLLNKGSDTITALFAMASLVSYFSHNIGAFFCWVRLLRIMILKMDLHFQMFLIVNLFRCCRLKIWNQSTLEHVLECYFFY